MQGFKQFLNEGKKELKADIDSVIKDHELTYTKKEEDLIYSLSDSHAFFTTEMTDAKSLEKFLDEYGDEDYFDPKAVDYAYKNLEKVVRFFSLTTAETKAIDALKKASQKLK